MELTSLGNILRDFIYLSNFAFFSHEYQVRSTCILNFFYTFLLQPLLQPFFFLISASSLFSFFTQLFIDFKIFFFWLPTIFLHIFHTDSFSGSQRLLKKSKKDLAISGSDICAYRWISLVQLLEN
ncbi:hypothetical protein ACOSQ4_007070 [Xanthoceras sorbifolium]